MSKSFGTIWYGLQNIAGLEQLSANNTPIHRLHTFTKLITTFVYIITVVSFDKYDIGGISYLFLFPILLMVLGELPFAALFSRLLVTVPFCAFAGISNLMFDREIAFTIVNIGVSYGLISFITLLLKTLFTVMAVLILVATTPITKLAHQLVRLKFPRLMLIQFVLTYRYIGVLISEAAQMYTAYILRSGRNNGIKMADMGSFAGQLLLRSFDRAQRIYHAMKCRGFDGSFRLFGEEHFRALDIVYGVVVCFLFLVVRIAALL